MALVAAELVVCPRSQKSGDQARCRWQKMPWIGIKGALNDDNNTLDGDTDWRRSIPSGRGPPPFSRHPIRGVGRLSSIWPDIGAWIHHRS
jgi:hypothetical protein